MQHQLLVVARSASALNKFEQGSLREAINMRDFLDQTGDYSEVSVFQFLSAEGPMKEWVKLDDLEA
ncbi:MAG: hypothetical protein OK456_09295 [Thaumarchaeota archaeon]|nr:hypothetical protein [Nitrososphaerota archaeon]